MREMPKNQCVSLCVLLGVLLAVPLCSCTPGRTDLDDPDAPEGKPDLASPLPVCAKGSVRCTADLSAQEECDGKGWEQRICDAGMGESCYLGRCATPCEQVGRGNVGCVFYPVNLWSTSDAGEFGIVATNTSDKLKAQVTLADASGVIETKAADPGGVAIFRLPHSRNKLTQTEQAKKSFVLTSTAPVAVYQFHPIDAATVFSGSATLLLPEHVLGRSYFAMSYTYNADLLTTPPQGQGFVAVVAVADGTEVEVTVPVQTRPGIGVPGVAAGGTLKRRLDRLEVLEVMQVSSLEDISGAQVKANQNVVVFGGAGGVSIPRTAVGGNHLGVQMFPLTTWGKRYVAAKVKQRNRTDRDYYRILASVDNTNVTLNGTGLPKVPVLKLGQFYEFDTDQDFEIVADQPIMVYQYMPAWGNLSGRYDPAEFPDGVSPRCPFQGGPDDVQCIGDANMTPLIPVEQYRKDYIFYVPATYTYDYINVTAPLGTKLVVDGMMQGDVLRPIGGTMLGRAIVRMRNPDTRIGSYHRITGTEPLGLIGYGYSYATSYSYAGGLNLEKINPIE